MSANDLKSLQEFFQSAVTGAEGFTAADASGRIAASSRLPAAAHLAIYRQGYFARLFECLSKQFKVLHLTLGDELFREFAFEYLSAFPSNSYTLNDLGARFADFLEASRPDKDESEKETWIDFMIELARFEWALFVQFDLPGQEGKPYADAGIPDEQLRLQPCFSLHHFQFPIAGYYCLAADGNLPDHPPAQESFVALVRKEYITGIYELKPLAYAFLQKMHEGKSVAASLQETENESGLEEEAVKALWEKWKAAWIPSGFFAADQRL